MSDELLTDTEREMDSYRAENERIRAGEAAIAAQQPEPAPVDLGQEAYEAYVQASDGVSLFSGQPLPAWDDQAENIRMAWRMSAGAVLIKDAQEPVPATELAAAMAENRKLHDTAIELIDEFGLSDDRWHARISREHMGRLRARLGLK